MDLFAFDTSPFDSFEQQILLFAVALQNYLSKELNQTVWPVHVPQTSTTTSPQLTYKLDRRQSFYSLAGATKLVQVVYDFTSIGPDKREVDQLSESVRGLLEGFRGDFGGLFVTGCRLNQRNYRYDPSATGSDNGTHEVTSQYTFMYQRQ